MRTSLDCIPCFIRQALEVARFVTEDTTLHERIVKDTLLAISNLDLTQSPPVMGQKIHRHLRDLTGQDDPYRDAKDRFNSLALRMLPQLREKVQVAEHPLRMAIRLAIAGNIIDLGVDGGIGEDDARRALENAAAQPLVGDLDQLEQAVSDAGRVLYLADNAGEIAFDRLLIERLSPGSVTVAVRGRPVINDATLVDARAVGLHDVARVIDNGSDAPGTVLGDCSPAFRSSFEQAELIIAKGQGNYETLSDQKGKVFFLLKVKCPVIASHIGVEVGSNVIKKADFTASQAV